MKSKILFTATVLFIFIVSSENLYSQAGFSPKIDSVINLCTNPILSKIIREFSGDTATIIGGLPYTILSRHSSSEHNPKAAQFIFECFQSYGLQPQYMNYSATGSNVYVKKTGTKYPYRQYIICAHYDDMPSGPLAPGADDNASGSCAVMESARLLANLNFDYTLIFILFDEEEQGLIGSKNYVDSAYFRGDTILGAINLDMISWDGNNDYQINIRSNTQSLPLAYGTINVFYLYQPILIPFLIMNVTSSDHASFWTRSYKAICGIQQRSEYNQYYHTVNDKFQIISMPYYLSYTRSSIAALMTYGWDYLVDIIHTPITVSPPLVPVNAAAVIKSPHKIAKNINGPRLYYKVNNGSMNFVNYNYYNLDTFKFTIPGQSAGSSVKYYIAAQDSLGRFIATKPSRGRGINPPGTVEPDSLISYSVITGIASNNRNLKYSLEQNYPNPFNITTTINYHLANNSNVSLKVFDITGKEIAVLVNKKQNTGNHKVEWDASQFSSGVYFYKLTTDNYIDTKKMLMIK
jgi:hypothetical protein